MAERGYPARAEAERILAEAEPHNPGPWGDHCRTAARCAERIAMRCEGMNPEKAYTLGLLHDIGRRFGVKHLGHVYDGWQYMLRLGYPEAARACLTHSFVTKDIHDYVGRFDIPEEAQREIEDALHALTFDDYDRLVILCDAISGAEGVMDMEDRMADVARRYGHYPEDKREANRALRRYFEAKMGADLYTVVGRDDTEEKGMQFDEAYFDAGIDRRGTNTIKWDRSRAQHGEDLLPMFIADMDFAGAPAITEALVRRAAHAAYGYTVMMDEDYDAMIGFWQRRHGLTFAREDVLTIPGVVPGINMTIRALTKPGDGVIIQTPVYGPFRMQIEATERRVMEAPLIRHEDGSYDMDLAAVEAQCRAGAKLMVLCNPHNPASRAWTREELAALMAVLEKYGVPLAADEIHADFVYAPAVFTPVLSIRRSNTVMFCAPGKTFNLAGLQHASIVCCDAEIRARIQHEIHACELTSGNVMALTAARAAYTDCDAWLDGLLAYLKGNVKALEAAVAKYLPKAVLSPINATYLGWLDLRAYGFDNEELMKRSIGAGVQFNGGTFFGDLGNGYLRINIACPRRNIEEAIKRLAKGLA